MISPRPTVSELTSLAGISGASSVKGAPSPAFTNAQTAEALVFASLLDTEFAAQPFNEASAPVSLEPGKILPRGKLAGNALPVGTILPLERMQSDTTPAETVTQQDARLSLQSENSEDLGAVPLMPAQPVQIAVSEPSTFKTKSALPLKLTFSANPTTVSSTPAASGAESANLPSQANPASAIPTAIGVQKAKAGELPTRHSSNSPISPAINGPVTQLINATSTRETLDPSPSMLTKAMPIITPSSGEPVPALGMPSAAANTAAPELIVHAPLAPRDFEALIDRLAQAREIAQPGAARVSLAHSEFGQVNLRFEASIGASTAANTMIVTMTSHDPDFALAARTALAERIVPVPGHTHDDASSGVNDHVANGNSSGQPHGHNQSQMDNHRRTASNHALPGLERDLSPDPDLPANAGPANCSPENRGLYA